MSPGPLVSVCIPAFNAAHQLRESIGSASRQTFTSLEILVVDNASTDDTAQLVASLAAKDARVRYLRHARNLGMVGNFNACIEQARGDYIKFVCADDLIEPRCVERMVDIMSVYPRVSLTACARFLIGGDRRRAKVVRYSRRFQLSEGSAAIRRCLFLGNLIGEPTAVMFRRADADRGFDEGYPQLVDLEMWLHLLEGGAFAFLPEPLCRIRQHAGQATAENLISGVVLDDKRRLFRRFLASLEGVSLYEKLLWDARMAVTAYRSRVAGHVFCPEDIEEVFFHAPFCKLTYPVVSALWRLLSRDR